MKIYRPVKTNLISQKFGLAGTAPSMIPLYNNLGLKAHDGYDYSVACKDNQVKHGGQCEQVYCNIAGEELEITTIQKSDEWGYGIIATDRFWNRYMWWHFDTINPVLYKGAKLKFGDLLGVAGNTGVSTGAHVHFAYYPVGENYENGYKGASDPTPFCDNRFCLEVKSQIEIIQKMIEVLIAIVKLFKK